MAYAILTMLGSHECACITFSIPQALSLYFKEEKKEGTFTHGSPCVKG